MTVYAFIDSQNLNLGTLQDGWKLDFGKFRIYLKNKYHVENAFLFIGYIKQNEKLYSKLRKFGYEIIFKPVLNHKGKPKGNVDAELVLQTMIEYPNYDKAIVVSGDGDFYCLEKYLKKNHKLAKIIVPNFKHSSLLKEFKEEDYILNLNEVGNHLKK
jgi:uncharacterized LabA/DUF88 family protein